MVEDVRPSWDRTWMAIADDFSRRSRCSRFQVGVVLVAPDQVLLSSGYNGPPAAFPADGPCNQWCPRAQRTDGIVDPKYDDCHAVHAEANALVRADYARMAGSTLYASTSVCKGCAKSVANSGVVRVVHRVGGDRYRSPELTEAFLRECGLEVVRFED